MNFFSSSLLSIFEWDAKSKGRKKKVICVWSNWQVMSTVSVLCSNRVNKIFPSCFFAWILLRKEVFTMMKRKIFRKESSDKWNQGNPTLRHCHPIYISLHPSLQRLRKTRKNDSLSMKNSKNNSKQFYLFFVRHCQFLLTISFVSKLRAKKKEEDKSHCVNPFSFLWQHIFLLFIYLIIDNL